MRFPVVSHTDDGIRFGVTAPDLPGCLSADDTFDEALDSVIEAIDLHLEGLVEDGGEIPIPGSIAQHRVNPDFTDGIWAVVDVNVSRFEESAEPINIALPRRSLTKIDAYASAHSAGRSDFLADAARAALR